MNEFNIVMICAGTEGELYGLTSDGAVLQFNAGYPPGDQGQGRIYDGKTAGWENLPMCYSSSIPHQLKAK